MTINVVTSVTAIMSDSDHDLVTTNAPRGVSITMTTDAVVQCPHGDGIDWYDVEIRVSSAGQTVECGSLQDYINQYRDVEVTQETFSYELGEAINDAIPNASVTVKVEGKHSGIKNEVVVR